MTFVYLLSRQHVSNGIQACAHGEPQRLGYSWLDVVWWEGVCQRSWSQHICLHSCIALLFPRYSLCLLPSCSGLSYTCFPANLATATFFLIVAAVEVE